MRYLKGFVDITQALQHLFKSAKIPEPKNRHTSLHMAAIWNEARWPQQVDWILVKDMSIHSYTIYAALSDKNTSTRDTKFG